MIPAFIGAAAAGVDQSTVRWDPASLFYGTLSNGNRTYTGDVSTGGSALSGLKTSGSWYAEAQFVTNSIADSIGFVLANQSSVNGTQVGTTEGTPEWGLSVGLNSAYRGMWHNASRSFPGGLSSAVNAYVLGDVVQLAVEMSTGNMWWGVNGVWLASGAPLATAGAVSNMKLAVSSYSGAGSFTIMDALLYPPPSGFLPL